MIKDTILHTCTKCGSSNIRKNGKRTSGKQKYHCRACNAYGTLNPSQGYSPERKAEILHAYQERSSLRGLERTFGVSRQTVAKWMREEAEALPVMPPLDPATPEDVLELDEM